MFLLSAVTLQLQDVFCLNGINAENWMVAGHEKSQ
jgi:hypothetical protein